MKPQFIKKIEANFYESGECLLQIVADAQTIAHIQDYVVKIHEEIIKRKTENI